jgi:Protein of unknown function (DUF1329)
MKRRSFGLLAGTSLAALKTGFAQAQTTPDASLLTTTLTPLGAERAGNADGSIPAWTGGLTTLPPGIQPNQAVPELFPNEQPVVVIDASNMAQHADHLSDGVMAMMTKYGFKITVYPTHRTAAAPQYVYDNTRQNLSSAQLNPGGGRLGFANAYGGIPFPIPDTSDPFKAGAQIMWNNNTTWNGYAYLVQEQNWVVSTGRPIMSSSQITHYTTPYYDPKGSLASYDGKLDMQYVTYNGPADLVGQALLVWQYTDPTLHPQAVWELLNGQGRVRRAPEVSFDTPATQVNGIAGYDEFYGFNGSLERYDWKYLGKKEMYIPYNNNKLSNGPAEPAHLAHFLDPDLVRWELHRCWVVEATLHPGERNVLPRRRFYQDEDTWSIGVADGWDANNNLFKVNIKYNQCRADLPGTIYSVDTVNNLQTDDYASLGGIWDQNASPLKFVDSLPASIFDATNMAAQSQY